MPIITNSRQVLRRLKLRSNSDYASLQMASVLQCVTIEVCCVGPGGIETHAWALMSTFMTEVLSKADWVKLWDHVLSNSPPFFMFLLLSYLVHFRAQIMSAESMQQMETITRRCNPVDLNQVMMQNDRLHCLSRVTVSLLSHVTMVMTLDMVLAR